MSFSYENFKKFERGERMKPNQQWEHLKRGLLSPLPSSDHLYVLAIVLISVAEAALWPKSSRLGPWLKSLYTLTNWLKVPWRWLQRRPKSIWTPKTHTMVLMARPVSTSFSSYSTLNPVQMEEGNLTILTIRRKVQATQKLHLACVVFPKHHASISGGDFPHKEAGALPGADLKGT